MAKIITTKVVDTLRIKHSYLYVQVPVHCTCISTAISLSVNCALPVSIQYNYVPALWGFCCGVLTFDTEAGLTIYPVHVYMRDWAQ